MNLELFWNNKTNMTTQESNVEDKIESMDDPAPFMAYKEVIIIKINESNGSEFRITMN